MRINLISQEVRSGLKQDSIANKESYKSQSNTFLIYGNHKLSKAVSLSFKNNIAFKGTGGKGEGKGGNGKSMVDELLAAYERIRMQNPLTAIARNLDCLPEESQDATFAELVELAFTKPELKIELCNSVIRMDRESESGEKYMERLLDLVQGEKDINLLNLLVENSLCDFDDEGNSPHFDKMISKTLEFGTQDTLSKLILGWSVPLEKRAHSFRKLLKIAPEFAKKDGCNKSQLLGNLAESYAFILSERCIHEEHVELFNSLVDLSYEINEGKSRCCVAMEVRHLVGIYPGLEDGYRRLIKGLTNSQLTSVLE